MEIWIHHEIELRSSFLSILVVCRLIVVEEEEQSEKRRGGRLAWSCFRSMKFQIVSPL
jgi:hypothetical protein